MVHVDNKGIMDGLWRERHEVHWSKNEGRRFVDFDLGNMHRCQQEGRLVEVEHGKALRSKTEIQLMSLFEKCHGGQ